MGRGASKSFLAAVQKSNNAAIAANEKKAKRETEHTTSLRKSPAGQKSTKELLLEFFEFQLATKLRFVKLGDGYVLHDFLEDPERPGVRIFTLEKHKQNWLKDGGGKVTATTVAHGSLRKCLMKASALGAFKRPKKFGEPT